MTLGTIEIVARYPRLVFPYALTKVSIEVDGNVTTRSWGTHSFGVSPGTHTVALWYRGPMWDFGLRRAVRVDVGAGETARVTYRAPYLRFFTGRITGENVTPLRDRRSRKEKLTSGSDDELLAKWSDFAEAERSAQPTVVRRSLAKGRKAIERELQKRGVPPPEQH